jgi:hypothetical protein
MSAQVSGGLADIARGGAVWADPLLPLVFFGGLVPAQTAQTGAMEYLLAGGEQRPWICDLAQAWWEGQDDAREMMSLLGKMGSNAGNGSPEHRRTLLAACLCARSTLHLEADGHLDEPTLSALEQWAWGDESVDVRPAACRCRWGYAIDASDASYAAHDSASSYAIEMGSAYDPIERHRQVHLRALCDLIRAAIPVCPLIEPAR